MRVDGALVPRLADFSKTLEQELSELVVQSLMTRMRDALLAGQSLELPQIGELLVHRRDPYALVNPIDGSTRQLGGECSIQFRPDRELLRDLNAIRSNGDGC